MATASWNGVTLAETDRPEIVEGNVYFPMDSVNQDYLKPSNTRTTCPWKGVASYYSVEVNGQVNADAAWTYLDPKPAAKAIAGHIAFWKGVKVER